MQLDTIFMENTDDNVSGNDESTEEIKFSP